MAKMNLERGEIQRLADSVGFWWHSIDLGQGVVTKGFKRGDELRRELDGMPDLTGKTVLDIGAYDGYFSFEAERRGARRVVALDHYVWSLDLPKAIAYWRECKERNATPQPAERTPFWQPDRLPGKRAFDVAHRALNSSVEVVVGDFMTMDLAPLGTFDVVIYMGVLYHMENPVESMRRVAALTREVAVIETHSVEIPGYEDQEMWQFYSANQLNGDSSNWWGPNIRALVGLCRAAGFERVEVIRGPTRARGPNAFATATPHTVFAKIFRILPRWRQRIRHRRAIVRAYKPAGVALGQ